jgi:hypothetical protein
MQTRGCSPRQVDEIDAVAADGVDERGQKPIGIEGRRSDVPEIPIGRRLCVVTGAGAEQHEQAQPFGRLGGAGRGCEDVSSSRHEAS